MHVTVLCPVYNTPADLLEAAVSSALEQDGAGVRQLLLIDDASTSCATLTTLDKLRDTPGVRVVRTPKNAGPALARNLGLDQVTSEWVGFLDSDDLWPRDKLKNARAALSLAPDATWIIGRSAVFSADQTLAAQLTQVAWSESGRACRPELTRSIILNGVHLGTCLIRKEAIGDLRFDPLVRFGEDLLFLTKLSLATCAWRDQNVAYVSRRQRTSLMWSAARLTDLFATGSRAGYTDPVLKGFRKEYRWALYAVYKDIAVNNLINGHRRRATLAALRAFSLDPREIRDLAYFLALLRIRERKTLSASARRYSSCEQVWLRPDGALDYVTSA